MNVKDLPYSMKYSIAMEAMRTAHPHEPFPLYKPRTRKERIRWLWIQTRWAVQKRFIKKGKKSSLNGKSLV